MDKSSLLIHAWKTGTAMTIQKIFKVFGLCHYGVINGETYTSNSLKISTCKKNQKEKKKDLLKISACNSTLLILEFYEIESAKNNSGSHQHFNFWYWVFHFSEQAQKELIKKIEEQRKRWPCEGHLGAENDIILLCHEE